MKYVIGLDAGTTCFKVGLYNEKLETVAQASEEYSLYYPGDGLVEYNADQYWQCFCRLIKAVVQKGEIDPSEVCSVAVSSQGETMIFLDENGNSLRNAIVWTDTRANKQKEELYQKYTDTEIFEVTGQREITSAWPAVKWMWLRENEPEIASKTKHVLLLGDYIVYRLTGKFASDKSLSSSTIYMDIRNGTWWDKMLADIGLEEELLPQLYECGTYIAHIQERAANETGLMTIASVCAGALDQAAGMIGSGNITEGIISETTGTCLAVCTNIGSKRVSFEKGKLPIHYGFSKNSYYAIYWSGAAGSILRWAAQNFYSDIKDSTLYKQMDREASNIAPGANGLILMPYLSGMNYPYADEKATGIFFGVNLCHSRAHFVRAILEAVSFLLCQSVDEIRAYGIDVKKIYSLGGGASSELWCKIKADMTGCEIVVPKRDEVTCLGAAILAAVGAGLYSTLEEAVMASSDRQTLYVPQYQKEYSDICNSYKKKADDYYIKNRQVV